MPKCERKGNVIWTIDKDVIKSIFYDNLAHRKNEYAGTITFEDTNCRKVNGDKVCDKMYKNSSLKKGNGDSVSTPLAVVNFHTHPKICYINENVIYGWPSGEDMRECINFAKKGNLIHLIMSMEGTYSIVTTINSSKMKYNIINTIENLLIITHEYRTSEMYRMKFWNNFLKHINLSQSTNSLDQWLNLVNNLTTRNVVTLSIKNEIINMKKGSSFLTEYSDILDEKIFSARLFDPNEDINIIQSYVKENCNL